MQPILAVLMIAGAIVTTGCSSLLSLQPVVTEQQATFEPALVGSWSGDGDDDLFVIRQTKDWQYRIRYGPADFDGRLFQAGNAWFLDVTPKEESALQVPAHAVVRLWLEGDTLRWTFIESDWIKLRIAERRLAAQEAGKVLLVTAPGDAVRGLLAAEGADERAHDKIQELKRLR